MDVYATFDAGGFIVAFFDDDSTDRPETAVEVGEDGRSRIVSAPQYVRWDGAALVDLPIPPLTPVLPDISRRQFAQVLAFDGVITQPEALAWAARGDLPQKLKDALTKIPEAGSQRFGAEMLLSAATTYQRNDPLVPKLGALLGYDAAALDAIWTRGASL